jgi:hypothetical protein
MKASPLILCMALACTAGHALAQLRKDPNPYWIKKYQEIGRMFDTKNANAFAATLDKNFVFIDDKRQRTSRAVFLGMEMGMLAQATSSHNVVKVTGIRYGKGHTDVSYDWRYRLGMKDAKGPYLLDGREIGTDSWRQSGKSWLCYKTVVQSSTEKRIPSPKRPIRR